jgi:hypothetical protein
VVHEYISPDEKPVKSTVTNKNCWILATPGEGVRSRGVTQEEKFLKDVEILLPEYEKNPDDKRTLFYLAQSYRDAHKLEEAIKYYKLRANAGGWEEEAYYSQYQVGKLMLYCDEYTFEEAKAELLKACEMRPTRSAEPLYELVKYQRANEKFVSSCFFGIAATAFLAYPMNDTLFVDKMVYDWKLRDELGWSLLKANQFEAAAQHFDNLIMRQGIPPQVKQRVVANMGLALERIPKLCGLVQQ